MMLTKRQWTSLEMLFHTCNTVICIGLMLFIEGWQLALSSYTQFDSTEFIFSYWIFMLILGAMRNPSLKYMAGPLLGIVLFDSYSSIEVINLAHDISAILFFAITCFIFIRNKRKFNKIIGFIILFGSPLALYHLYMAELAVIILLMIYLVKVSFQLWRLK